MMAYFVEIVEKGGEVIKEIDANSYANAERIERGVNINLNHESYYTRIVYREEKE